MIEVGATLDGDCAPWPSMKNLAAILSEGGLDVAILTFTVHVRNCRHFYFEYAGNAAEPFILAESETPEEMCEEGKLVSAALSAAGVRHRFEVLDLEGNRVAYLHHEWLARRSAQPLDLRTEPPGSHTVSTQHHRVTLVSLPPESRIAKAYASTSLADAYSIELPSGASTNPELLARFIFSHQAPWISSLIAVRDAIVGRFGLKTAKQLTSFGAESKTGRVGIFKIYGTSPTEIVLGEDDKHLDFRLSVLCSSQSSPGGKRQLTLSTVVHCHNRLGRLYILVIAPFHRLVVQSSLRNAARIGWPLATEA